MRTVLVNFEIPPEKLKANIETKAQNEKQISGLRDIVSGDCKKKDGEKFARTLQVRFRMLRDKNLLYL